MVEEGTTITRLLDKLERAGYIRRERSVPDRRQVICYVAPDGKKLMDKLDPLVDDADADVMAALSAKQVEQLIDLLDIVRAANAEKGAPRSDRSSIG
jgi:DNA-binding MarR family transcriptional regulator